MCCFPAFSCCWFRVVVLLCGCGLCWIVVLGVVLWVRVVTCLVPMCHVVCFCPLWCRAGFVSLWLLWGGIALCWFRFRVDVLLGFVLVCFMLVSLRVCLLLRFVVVF